MVAGDAAGTGQRRRKNRRLRRKWRGRDESRPYPVMVPSSVPMAAGVRRLRRTPTGRDVCAAPRRGAINRALCGYMLGRGRKRGTTNALHPTAQSAPHGALFLWERERCARTTMRARCPFARPVGRPRCVTAHAAMLFASVLFLSLKQTRDFLTSQPAQMSCAVSRRTAKKENRLSRRFLVGVCGGR